MPATPKAPISPAVVRWARETAGHTVDSAARRLNVRPERLESWESGEDHPTVVQLRAMAGLYRRTPATFFLPDPPTDRDEATPPDFRSVRAAQGGVSPGLRRELVKAAERRRAALDLGLGGAVSFSTLEVNVDHIERSARAVRSFLRFPLEEQMAMSAGDGLARWIGAVEEFGVLVFHMSRISSDESRGFSIYEPDAPVIVLNGGEPDYARSFTLLHELCHLLHHSGGICTLYANRQVERRCNEFAGAVLMPGIEFLQVAEEATVDDVPQLAARFRVSEGAAAVRMRHFDLITQDDLDEVLRISDERVERARQQQREREGGPMHHRTHLRNLGARYVAGVLDAVDDDRISLVDAAHYLDSKVSTIERMERELQSRGARQ
jgi:Zn-dependent peptidase ImmA (M78 family)